MTSIQDWTYEYINTTNKNHLKKYGQYFTPKDIIDTLSLHPSFNPSKESTVKALEPCFGTGLLIEKIASQLKNFDYQLECVELDPILYQGTKNCIEPHSNTSLIQQDFFNYSKDLESEFDLIIGNPPNYEMYKPNKHLKNRFHTVIYGKLNIFTLFLYECIRLLKPYGHLYFVIPQSFTSSKHFAKLRESILTHTEIIDLIKFDTNSLVLKLRKLTIRENGFQMSKKFVLRRNGRMYFVKKNESVWFTQNFPTTNISSLGGYVKTGAVVWNQHRKKLFEYPLEEFPTIELIRPRNISILNGTLDKADCLFMRPTKSYVKYLEKGPFLLVNYVASRNTIKLYVYLEKDPNVKYFIENHLKIIKIKDTHGTLNKLERIKNSLESPKTLEFIQKLFGNTQLNSDELENIIPIF